MKYKKLPFQGATHDPLRFEIEITVRKNRFVQTLKKRLFLRFHMSLILIGTALVGFLASKLLLLSHVINMVICYPLAGAA